MKTTRRIKKIFRSRPTLEGAGVHLRRAFGFDNTELFDPFLLLDDFRSDNPEQYIKGFPWHPHRGIETITYMLKGTVEHGDSLGNGGIISAGDVQWMTAGSGIVHQEMPAGDDKGSMHGFQLWANLPSFRKMMDPRYRDIKSSDIPVVRHENGVEIRVICGRAGDISGPVTDVVIEPEYLDIAVPPDTEYIHEAPREKNVMVYIFEGSADFCAAEKGFMPDIPGGNYFDYPPEKIQGNRTLIVYDEGDEIRVKTDANHVRFLYIAGKPLKEPVAWYGPIVMNTREELCTAFQELDEGTFIKHKLKK